MSTTVSNSNPIKITGGTMASGARATIYPNQIARSFQVTAVEFITATAGNTFSINDNSTANNVLCQGIAPTTNSIVSCLPSTPVTWGDWKVTSLQAADTLLVYIL